MKHHLFILILLGLSTHAFTQDQGGAFSHPTGPCLLPKERATIQQRLQDNRKLLLVSAGLNTVRSKQVNLSLPIKASSSFADHHFFGISNYVDHNENIGELLDYNCGARSYDTESGYNHRGIDYFSWPFSWSLMDNDMVEIIAAAPGTIIGKDDGHDDKSCSFNSSPWNAVYIEHTDGSVAWYGHLKTASITSKAVGETVETGEFLGIMGSSGNSTGPHLHFELYDASGNLVDPYEGSCNPTSNTTWWHEQEPYYSSTINALKTHDAAPQFGCYNVESPNIEDEFTVGQTIYFATYFRDQKIEHISSHQVLRPDGSVFESWTTQSNAEHYSASYWYRSFHIPLSEQHGVWTFSVEYLGKHYQHTFCISPTRPFISTNGNQLISSSDVNNQWFLNEEAIDGATAKTYNATENGSYTVHVTAEGCPPSAFASALDFEVIVTGSDNLISEVELYPVPCGDQIRLNKLPKGTSLTIFSLAGNIRLHASEIQDGWLDIAHLAAGIYIFKISTPYGNKLHSVIKN